MILAGPGTGKTTRIKEIIKAANPSRVLVLSFTNATINDLLGNFAREGIKVSESQCMTLHKFAMKLNHLVDVHILEGGNEEPIIRSFADGLDIDFDQMCSFLNCITFEKMIVDCLSFIKANPAYSKEKIGELDLLIVDEYQDFNPVERSLIDETAELAKETVILGDDDQCIYGFKNADSEGIINLHKDTTVIKIDHDNICYRCPRDVVLAISSLIGLNKNRVSKELKVHNKFDGLAYNQTLTQSDTNQWVYSKIQEIRKNDPNASIMILSNVSFTALPLIGYLSANSVDVANWWQEKMDQETLLQIWWLRSIFSKYQLLNLLFILTKSKGFKSKQNVILELLKKRFILGSQDDEETVKQIVDLSVLEPITAQYVLTKPTMNLFFQNVPAYSKYSKYFPDDVTTERNLKKLVAIISEKTNFDPTKINVLSIHKSKGLQSDHVFILGLVDGILPNESQAVITLEAQRRLFYVGLSRAKKGLYLLAQKEWSSAIMFRKIDKGKFKHKGRKIVYGQASQFIKELGIL